MGLIKRANGNYQARIKGADGKIICETFPTKGAALEKLMKWKLEKKACTLGTSIQRRKTVKEFFEEWHKDVSAESHAKTSSGWRETQKQYFRDYIEPVLGRYELRTVSPQMVKRVFNEMAQKGRAPQSQRLVYSTLRKMFGDAVENYQYLTFNPVIRKIKPSVPQTEAKHLNLEQVKRLLKHVENKKYGLAIWIQIYLGLRAGELIALKWEDVDLEAGRIFIRRTYVKKTGEFRDYPKGGKHHSHSIPEELIEMLAAARAVALSRGGDAAARTIAKDFVLISPHGEDYHLPYRWYLMALRSYCEELELPIIGTHGLRHSTSELYIHHGATRDDLRRLFAHSSQSVTDRYVHDRGSNLEKVAKVIQLFGVESDPEVTPRAVRQNS